MVGLRVAFVVVVQAEVVEEVVEAGAPDFFWGCFG